MDKLVSVFTAHDVSQACVIKHALENADISVQIEDETLQSGAGRQGARQLSVPRARAAQARDIVASILPGPQVVQSDASKDDASVAMVLMHVKYDDFVEDEVEELGQDAIKLCKQHPGFISAKQFCVKEGNEQYILLAWENELAFATCKQSSAWLLLMPQWSALQEDGDAILDINVLTDP